MKNILTVIITFLMVIVFCPHVYAEMNNRQLDDLKYKIEERISSALDDDTESELRDAGITPTDIDSLTGLDQRSFFASLWDKFTEMLTKPLVMLGRILAVSLIYSAMNML